MTPPNASVAALFTDAASFKSRLEATAHDTESFIKQLGYLAAEWPLDQRDYEPAFDTITHATDLLEVLAQRLRRKAEEA